MPKLKLFHRRVVSTIVLAFLIILVPVSSYSQNQNLSKKIKKTFVKGKKHYKGNEYNLAIECFIKVHEANPTHIDNLYFLTKTYYYKLEDYPNAYQYGEELLKILHNDLEKLDPIDQKKKYNNKKDFVEDVELLVYFSNRESSFVENDTIKEVLNKEQDFIDDKSESVVDEQVVLNGQVDSQVEVNIVEPPVEDKRLIVPFEGFAIPNSKNNVKVDIINAVTKQYNDTKRNFGKSYNVVLQDDANIQSAINTYNTRYVEQLKINEANLFEAIYRYNRSLFQRDSVEQLAVSISKRNYLLFEEINSLDYSLSEISGDDQISSSIDFDKKKTKQKVFIGRYKIEKSLKNSDTKRILNEVLWLVQTNTDFYNPKVNSFVTFINSFDDIKYSYFVTKVIDSGIETNPSVSDGNYNNLEVFEFESNHFVNIVSKERIESRSIGLKGDEYQLIQGMNQYAKNGNSLSEYDTSYCILKEKLKRNIEHQKSTLIEELRENRELLDSLSQVNMTTFHLNEYEMQIEKYNSSINNVQSFANYLVINEELNSKTANEQYSDMTKEIVDLVFENFEGKCLRINKIRTFADTSSPVMQIKFMQDSITLIPSINRYKILSLSRVKFSDSDVSYFAIDLGFVMDYTIPDNMISNEAAVTYNAHITSDDKTSDVVTPDYSQLFVGEYQVKTKEDLKFLVGQDEKEWKALIDNPSSYTSYMMFQEEEGWRLPTLSELKSIIAYLVSDKRKLDQLAWPKDGAVYLSSDSHFDKRNNEKYKAVKLSGSFFVDIEVEGGDEVFLIVITE